MKKIYSYGVLEFNKRTKRFEPIDEESDYHYIDDKEPIAYCGGGAPSGGGGGTTQTVQKADPWAGQQPYLSRGFNETADAYLNDPLPKFYPGSTVVPFSPETNLALQLQENRAVSGSPVQDAGNAQLTSTLRGDYLNNVGNLISTPQTVESMNSLVMPTIRGDYLYGGDGFNAAYQAAANKIIPQVDSTFARSGRSGSGLAQEAKTRALADAFAQQYGQERQNQLGAAQLGQDLTKTYMDNLGRERDNQIRSMLFAPQMASLDYQDYSKLAEVGAQKESLDQQNLADQVARWDYDQNAQRNSVSAYMNLIQGNYGGQTSGTSTSNLQNSGGGGFGAMNILGGVGGLLAAPLLGVNPVMGLLGGLSI